MRSQLDDAQRPAGDHPPCGVLKSFVVRIFRTLTSTVSTHRRPWRHENSLVLRCSFLAWMSATAPEVNVFCCLSTSGTSDPVPTVKTAWHWMPNNLLIPVCAHAEARYAVRQPVSFKFLFPAAMRQPHRQVEETVRSVGRGLPPRARRCRHLDEARPVPTQNRNLGHISAAKPNG
jgi:hypothetical protein